MRNVELAVLLIAFVAVVAALVWFIAVQIGPSFDYQNMRKQNHAVIEYLRKEGNNEKI